SASVINVTRRDLQRRKRRIFRELGVTPESFEKKIDSAAPLTNREWSAMEELAEIRFLLGDDTP
ncbi:MAG: hypothetical protein ACKOE2_04300, partial [Actinomycetales bacterium]